MVALWLATLCEKMSSTCRPLSVWASSSCFCFQKCRPDGDYRPLVGVCNVSVCLHAEVSWDMLQPLTHDEMFSVG